MVQDAAPLYPTVSEQENSKMELLYRDCKVHVDDPVVEQESILNIDNVPICMPCSLNIIKGNAKEGKSMAANILTAALVSGKLWRFSTPKPVRKAALFDTEQSPQDSVLRLKSIGHLAGCDDDEIEDAVSVFNVRELTPDERLELVEFTLGKIHPEVAIIDCAIDLCPDYNDLSMSQKTLQTLVRFCNEYKCAVYLVFHTNPSSNKSVGSYGSNSDRKAELVLLVKKHANLFTVSCSISRHEPPPSWNFRFNAEGNLESADTLIQNELLEQEENKKTEKTAKVMEELSDLGIPRLVADYTLEHEGLVTESELVAMLTEKLTTEEKQYDRSTARRKIRFLAEMGYLECEPDASDSKKRCYRLSDAVDTPIDDLFSRDELPIMPDDCENE